MMRRAYQAIGYESLRDLVADVLVPEDGMADLLGGEDPLDGARTVTDLPRLRPILVALAARAAGGDQVEREAQYAAELLHLALGVHDLALGREGGRRRTGARRLLRRSASFLGGSRLTWRAVELARLVSPPVMEEIIATLREFNEGHTLCQDLLSGELASRGDWREHADTSTGALFAFCCKTGGHLAGADLGTRSALGRYGRHLGRLWHVAEDMAAIRAGDAAEHLLNRALQGRPVLPIICAAEVDPEVAPAWAALRDEPSPENARRLADILVRPGRLAGAVEVMVQESWWACQVLDALPASRYRKAFETLARGIAKAGTRPSEA